MGYRLRDRFAELSAERFERGTKLYGRLCHLEPLTNRLMLNSLLISHVNGAGYTDTFTRYRPMFLKGLPSNLSCLASVLSNAERQVSGLKAVFSVGENLLEHQRRLIERVFSCKVIDCYGQMERTVAISQCPHGSYHVHSDYGFAEFAEPEIHSGFDYQPDPSVREIVGTCLYNLSMPLIRYRTGDLVLLKNPEQPCLCGRAFPVVGSIIGRSADVVETSDGRFITALYTALDKTTGIISGQIVQECLNELSVRIAVLPDAENKVEDELRAKIRNLTGDSMNIRIKRTTVDEVRGTGAGKFKVVVSRLPHNLYSGNCSV
jgi:phenylacetate-CoA ligase